MDARDQFVTYFREVQPKFSRFYAHLLTQADITLPQYALLNELNRAGVISMTDIGRKLHITKPAVTNLVDRLEENRLVKRIAHPKDRRIYLLEIQSRGRTAVHKIQGRVLRFLLEALDQFSPKEQEIITSFYASLSKKIEDSLITIRKTLR